MAISFVGYADGTSGNLTLSGVQEGDICLFYAYRDGSTNSFPSGTTAWPDGGGTANNFQIGKVYTHTVTAGEGSAGSVTTDLAWGGITAATTVLLVAYRGAQSIGTAAHTGASSTTITYPALTLSVTDGTSWVVAVAAHRSVNTSLQTAPAGLTNRISLLDSTAHIVVHDGARSNWASTDVAVGGTASGWRSATVELVAAAGGGGGAELFGAGVSSATTAGSITTAIPLAGAAVSTVTATGNVTTAIPLSGVSAAVSGGAGVLNTSLTLQGAALAQAAAGASELTVQIRLSGSAVAHAAATGDLAAETASLSGAAQAITTATGLLGTAIPLAGQATAVASGVGSLGVPVELSGVAAAVATATGELTIALSLSGAAIAQALAAGTLTAHIPLQGGAVAQAAANGTLAGTTFEIHAARIRKIRAPSRVLRVASPQRILRIRP